MKQFFKNFDEFKKETLFELGDSITIRYLKDGRKIKGIITCFELHPDLGYIITVGSTMYTLKELGEYFEYLDPRTSSWKKFQTQATPHPISKFKVGYVYYSECVNQSKLFYLESKKPHKVTNLYSFNNKEYVVFDNELVAEIVEYDGNEQAKFFIQDGEKSCLLYINSLQKGCKFKQNEIYFLKKDNEMKGTALIDKRDLFEDGQEFVEACIDLNGEKFKIRTIIMSNPDEFFSFDDMKCSARWGCDG